MAANHWATTLSLSGTQIQFYWGAGYYHSPFSPFLSGMGDYTQISLKTPELSVELTAILGAAAAYFGKNKKRMKRIRMGGAVVQQKIYTSLVTDEQAGRDITWGHTIRAMVTQLEVPPTARTAAWFPALLVCWMLVSSSVLRR